MANGIIIIDKPQDWTSMDVCAKLRGMLKTKKIGHAGTLDPMATGVLPVFVGQATRAVSFAESGSKEYVAGLRLGLVTNTQDTSGETLEEHPVTVTAEGLRAVLPCFTGEIEQIPPMFSAIKIGGKKLYELARQGKTVERKARDIEILELELLDGEGTDWQFRVRCSKGTYVRTLCHDIGQALGCGGCMSGLRRTQAGCYGIGQAVTMEALLAMEDPASRLLPVDSMFAGLPAIKARENQVKPIFNGAEIRIRDLRDGEYRVYGPDGTFLMVGRAEKGVVKTVKSFFEVSKP